MKDCHIDQYVGRSQDNKGYYIYLHLVHQKNSYHMKSLLIALYKSSLHKLYKFSLDVNNFEL